MAGMPSLGTPPDINSDRSIARLLVSVRHPLSDCGAEMTEASARVHAESREARIILGQEDVRMWLSLLIIFHQESCLATASAMAAVRRSSNDETTNRSVTELEIETTLKRS